MERLFACAVDRLIASCDHDLSEFGLLDPLSLFVFGAAKRHQYGLRAPGEVRSMNRKFEARPAILKLSSTKREHTNN